MSEAEPTIEQVRAQLRENSNWGRWGEDDQRGAVNLIDARKRIEAAALVRTGRSVSLSRDYPKEAGSNNPHPAQHYMRVVDQGHGGGFAADYYGIDYHGAASTHIDALCHTWDQNGGWNGRDPKEYITFGGATWGGIEHWRDGVTTRGVLLDVPRHRGTPYVTEESPVHGDELHAIARAQGVQLSPGDAIVVYSGRGAYEEENGPWAGQPTMPGLHASCLWFLRDSDCSMVLWDMADALPQSYDSQMPFTVHSCIFAYGIAVVDNTQLEALAAACAEEMRYEFMLTLAPLPAIGGTGSPVNPIALL